MASSRRVETALCPVLSSIAPIVELAAAAADAHHVLGGIVDGNAEPAQAVFHAPVVVAFAGITDGARAIGQRRDGAVTQRQRLAARQRGFEMKRALLPGLEIENRRKGLGDVEESRQRARQL